MKEMKNEIESTRNEARPGTIPQERSRVAQTSGVDRSSSRHVAGLDRRIRPLRSLADCRLDVSVDKVSEMSNSTLQLHAAIIGCGFTGTTALYQLVRSHPVTRVTIFETSGLFGPGFPYQPDETDAYVINNTNDTMCLDPANRRAFVEWLRQHDRYAGDLDEKGHMPRRVYGEFLRDIIAAARTEAAQKGIEVELIAAECTDIAENGGVTITYVGGSLSADIAILATGRCPDVDSFGFAGRPTYFATHMPGSQLSDLPTDAEVHILGASLSAYDVINELFAPETGCEFLPDRENRLRFIGNENQRTAVLCSRSGLLKKMQSRYPGKIRRPNFNAQTIAAMSSRTVTLRDLQSLVQSDAIANGVKLDAANVLTPYGGCYTAREYHQRVIEILANDIDAAMSSAPGRNFLVDYFANAEFDIWDFFAARCPAVDAEKTFRSNCETAFLNYAAPCPVSTGQKMLALARAGRLRFIKGIRDLREDGVGYRYEHDFGTGKATYLVNATGQVDRDVRSSRQPALVRNLVERGLLRPYELDGEASAGADVDMHTFRCNGAKNIYAANMLLWGPGFYVSAAITMATVIRRLLHAYFASRGVKSRPSPA